MSTTLTAAEFAQQYGLLPVTGTTPAPQTPGVVYTALTKDRWDLIAWKVYGDITLISLLVGVNQTVPITCEIPQGTKIFAPVITVPAPAPVTPWAP